ncbi:type II secretion system F family protein [Adhaeretor mobilis]|uniref:Type II secretion system protein F n=1 Tax=Adhaeretor mobilis TaxID=1930276 RepID=A0A517MVN7_9BACT|nr:type II secretion system F family protein [Adhaeretor mobilis]QDS98946.1 Putative type II secretion system protein F [Adhaeretor mobilis]
MSSTAASTPDWMTSEFARPTQAARSKSTRWGKPRVAKADLADFLDQLSIMSRSGIDLATALESLTSQCQKPQLAEVLERVSQAIVSGTTLSDALKQHPSIFDSAFVATVSAGEASGRMSEVLTHLAVVYRSEVRLLRTMKSLMTYPVLLSAVSCGVVVALVLFVLPRFAGIFEQYDMVLPVLTQMLISLADGLRSQWWLWLPLLALSVGGVYAWLSTEVGAHWWNRVCVKVPILSGITQPFCTGRICQMISLMLTSGVPLVEGLRLTEQSINNREYKGVLRDMTDAVVNGRSLSSVLSEADIFPQSARDMITTAEGSGKLEEVASLLGSYYEEEAEAKMRQALRIFEPAITVVMGAVIACIVLAVMLPVFDLSSIRNHH